MKTVFVLFTLFLASNFGASARADCGEQGTIQDRINACESEKSAQEFGKDWVLVTELAGTHPMNVILNPRDNRLILNRTGFSTYESAKKFCESYRLEARRFRLPSETELTTILSEGLYRDQSAIGDFRWSETAQIRVAIGMAFHSKNGIEPYFAETSKDGLYASFCLSTN